jgi:hypothetical protein
LDDDNRAPVVPSRQTDRRLSMPASDERVPSAAPRAPDQHQRNNLAGSRPQRRPPAARL